MLTCEIVEKKFVKWSVFFIKEFSTQSGKLEATYTFTESPLSEGEKFLVVLGSSRRK